MIAFSSDMHVELMRQSSATDAGVVYAARVSTTDVAFDQQYDPDRDAGLIRYLMRERHGSPFEHNSMTFFVRAPIFVWREHMRHRIASYNEESGRYKVLDPEFYVPDSDRRLVQVGKAGAYTFEHGTTDQYAIMFDTMCRSYAAAYSDYRSMLDSGIAREIARMVLPVSIYSSAYVTMNARALMNFLSLRTHDDAATFPSYPQREIEMIAEDYEAAFAHLMPVTHAAFVANGRVAP